MLHDKPQILLPLPDAPHCTAVSLRPERRYLVCSGVVKTQQKPTPGKGRKYIKAVTAVSAPHYFARRLFVVLYMVRRVGIAPTKVITSIYAITHRVY